MNVCLTSGNSASCVCAAVAEGGCHGKLRMFELHECSASNVDADMLLLLTATGQHGHLALQDLSRGYSAQ